MVQDDDDAPILSPSVQVLEPPIGAWTSLETTLETGLREPERGLLQDTVRPTACPHRALCWGSCWNEDPNPELPTEFSKIHARGACRRCVLCFHRGQAFEVSQGCPRWEPVSGSAPDYTECFEAERQQRIVESYTKEQADRFYRELKQVMVDCKRQQRAWTPWIWSAVGGLAAQAFCVAVTGPWRDGLFYVQLVCLCINLAALFTGTGLYMRRYDLPGAEL